MAQLDATQKLLLSFILFLASLSWWLQVVNSQSCSGSSHITANVTEGDPANMVVLNIRQLYSYGPEYFIIRTVHDSRESRVFNVYFDSDMANVHEIRTTRTVDRDAMARELENTFAPVVFQVNFLVFPIQNIDDGECINLELRVIDTDTNRPVFEDYESQPYLIRLVEGDPAQYQIPRATDDDEGINSTQTYTLVDDLGKFELDIQRRVDGEISQVLIVLQEGIELNYEDQTNYNLSVIASEGNESPDTATLMVYVTVVDRCDEDPYFPTSAYYHTVRENSPLDTVISSNITAMDMDLTRIRYTIHFVCSRVISGSNCNPVNLENHPFNLDRETGKLSLNGEVDREVIEEYIVIMHAIDGCGRSATASVTISVVDENDNPPDIAYIVGTSEVPETYPLNNNIGFFGIRDRDAGINGQFEVQLFENSSGVLLPSQTFQLVNESSMSWALTLQSSLDRESVSSYSLVVVVTDFGTPNLTSTYPLEITVLDSNDNPPVFQPINAVYIVQENRPVNTEIVMLTATDRDDPGNGNGQVSYTLPASNDSFPYQHLFSINSLSGSLKVAGRLDREEQESLYVLVIAQDNPTQYQQLSDQIQVNITLTDLNDNTPSMISPNGTYEIPENHPPGTTVLQITASDPDTAPFSTLTYSFAPNNSPFEVNPTSGVVTLNRNGLDYDRQMQSYDVMIEVRDSASNPNIGRVALTIRVIDVNDEAPVFDPPAVYMALVNEAELPYFLVAQVSASDLDTPRENLRYSISIKNNIQFESRFTISPTSGQIYTTTMLDRKVTSNYTLTVSVTDGVQSAESDAIVFITVVDSNDNVPEFENLPYRFEIEESRPRGKLVGSISANDLDSGRNGEVRYRILGVHPLNANWFHLDPMNGDLITITKIDRESNVLVSANSIVTLQIGARDLNSEVYQTTTASIRILDRNDERPYFPQLEITHNVSENFARGATILTVNAIDNDLHPNDRTVYSIAADFPPGITDQFFINPTTGDLSLQTTLDFETQARYQFRVIAKEADPDLQNKQAFQTIIINVENARELNLKCDDFTPLVNFTEYSMINHPPVLTFECTDLQDNSVDQVEYTLTNADGTASQYFGIRENSMHQAIVYPLVDIDREALPMQANSVVQITVNITARDPNPSEDSYGSINNTLTVRILDLNDRFPEFGQESHSFRVTENNNPDSRVGEVTAVDLDNAENGTVSYLIQDSSLPFRIEDGVLYTTSRLDRELRSYYEFTVTARDGGSPPKERKANVRVNVTDLNDNVPMFDSRQNRSIIVGEETAVGSIVETIQVIDEDSDMFGPITITASGLDSHFRLFSNGSLILQEPLDRERQEFYSFVATAEDSDQMSQPATFNIEVRDYNDNPPIFNAGPTEVTISEMENHLPFITLSASDADTGRNADIRYELADYSLSRTFCIGSSGELSLCLPDRMCLMGDDIVDFERQTEYDVTVIAYDVGTPRHIVSKTITVRVTNVNEHSPLFDRGYLIVFVDENQQNGAVVAKVRAYDWDYDPLIYEILENGEPSTNFRYNNGTILTDRILDFNANPFYVITLMASERAGTLSGTMFVIVRVNNINNHPPMFNVRDYPTSARISELTEVGEIVLTVHADDADNATHDAVSYSIESGGNIDGAFEIDSLTGDIYVNNSLDFDTRSMYTLTILAKDSGDPQLMQTLQISISLDNENDEYPVFDSSEYHFNLAENTASETSVGTVHAEDNDIGSVFGTVRYSIMTQDVNPYISVNNVTGRVFSLQAIDREAYVAEFHNDTITFTVKAEDLARQPKSATTLVHVRITDMNDNTPMFSQAQYIVSIPPDQTPNIIIDTIVAHDPDFGRNGEFSYEIIPVTTGISLYISPSGELQLQHALSQPLDHYDFTLRAIDSQDSSRTSDATVRIVVETESDHHPQFEDHGVYEIEIIENTPILWPVFDVSEHVDDTDDGPSGVLTYSFSQDYPTFSINRTSGLITLAQSLDFESTKSYELTILAADSTPSGSRTATATLTIRVTGFNEFTPRFVSIPTSITLSPIPFIDIDLFTVTAEDDDDGVEGDLGYAISDQDQFFTIDSSSSGVVRNQGALVAGNTYNILITAFDRGSPILRSNATVSVTIADPGSNAPRFITPNTRLEMNEDIELGSLLTSFTTSPTAERYQLAYHNGTEGMFEISQDRGQLTLQGKLDYNTATQYRLIVEARRENRNDPSNPVYYSSYLEVNLFVSDVNDNPPRFVGNTVYQISESRPVDNNPVFSIHAIDDDDGPNADINYQILSTGNFERTFTINQVTGDVFLANSLDWAEYSSYDLTIRAFDLSSQPLTAQIVVHIDVEDENNHIPTFRGNYTIGVYEYSHTRMGDRIIKVAATDLDEGPQLSYTNIELIEARHMNEVRTASQDTFHLNENTGVISVGTIANLDREVIDYYLLRITVSDNIHQEMTYLTIRVLDVNDHPPVFSSSVSQISNCGEVTIYEQQPSGTIVTSAISATDQDAGINSWVQYSLGEGWPTGDHFMIDPNSGVIRINNTITYTPELLTIQGTVIVTDGGTPALSTSTTICIYVLDVNDHAPIFSRDSYVIPVFETTPAGANIYNFVITDQDFTQNNHFEINIPHYYDDAINVFHVNDNGELSIRNGGQPLQLRNYSFRIEARNIHANCARYQQASYADVTVVVLPDSIFITSNDNFPEFDNMPYRFETEEGLPEGTFVGSISANDLDSGRNGEVRYSILSVHPLNANWFHLDPMNGDLITTTTIDRESNVLVSANSIVTLQIGARDLNSVVHQTTTASIHILDINDERPYFLQPEITHNVSENFARGATILTVNAIDNDLHPNDKTVYSIAADFPPGITDQFFINPTTGDLGLQTTLDFETQVRYQFRVRAREADPDHQDVQAFQTIIINVENAHELNLKCDDFTPLVNFIEHSMINHPPVLTFECTDLHDNSVDQVEYTLTNAHGTASQYFGIRENSMRQAIVYPLVDIDREALPMQANSVVQITVNITARVPNSAEDSYGSINNILTVRILDLNDRFPEFGQESYSFRITENNNPDSRVGEVTAVDLDNAENGTVSYLIQDSSLPFRIDDGILYTTSRLDRELRSYYEFTVTARDGGSPPKERRANIRVNVTDLNDNAPMFDYKQNHTIIIGENTAVGCIFETIRVIDEDSDMFGPITITASRLDSHFRLFSNGSLILQEQFNQERQEFYTFFVAAEDSGSVRSFLDTYIIKVIPENHPPIFNQSFYNLTIREDQEINSPFFQFVVAEVDKCSSQNLTFSLTSVDQTSVPFSIDESTGELSLSEAVDAEIDEPMYSMRVIVSAGRLTSNTTVNVFIDDVNEPATITVDMETPFLVEEEITRGDLWILQLQDVDMDERSRNNDVVILSGEEFFIVQGSFSFEKLQTFRVSQNASIDRERNSSVELVLQIIQWGNPVLYDYRNFTLAIMDKNDNSPFLPDKAHNFEETDQDSETVFNICYVAQDNDDGNNGMISSFVIDSVTNAKNEDRTSEFRLRNDPNDCNLYVPPLDREKEGDFLTIAIHLYDNGLPPMKSADSFTLNLIDINDNCPIFMSEVYNFSVMENYNGRVRLGTVQAIDEDSGQNGNIAYMIHPGNYSELFSIDPSTGDVFTNTSFDRERKSSYTIYITARDNGSPVKFAETMAEVTVEIDDDNDNFPVFSDDQSEVKFTVDTSDGIGTVVGIMEAEDQDTEPNAQIVYQLDNPQQYFMVRNSTGEIVLSEQLPSEEMTYSLTISAYNPDFFEQRNTINVTIIATKSFTLSIPLIAGIAGGVFILVVLTLVASLTLLVINHKLNLANQEKKKANIYEDIEGFTPAPPLPLVQQQNNVAYGCQELPTPPLPMRQWKNVAYGYLCRGLQIPSGSETEV